MECTLEMRKQCKLWYKCCGIYDNGKVPPCAVVAQNSTSTNNARDKICRCGSKKDWEHMRNFVGWRNFNFCPECSGKLSPVA